MYFLSFLVFNDTSREITVISYNIRYDNPDDGQNKWDLRKHKVLSYLKETAPDIIGMQEVLKHQLFFLNDAMEEYSFVGVGREDGKSKGEYSPILYNTRNLKLVERNTFWLSETPCDVYNTCPY